MIARSAWVEAALALEDAGELPRAHRLARMLGTRESYARKIVQDMRADGTLIGDGARERVGPRGRALVGRPPLLYAAAELSPDPELTADRLLAWAASLAQVTGCASIMPDRATLAEAGHMRSRAAWHVLTAHAQRADLVVVVAGRDVLALQGRRDVVAAERAGIPLVIVESGEDAITLTLQACGRRP